MYTTVSIALYKRSDGHSSPRSYHFAVVVSVGEPQGLVDLYQIENTSMAREDWYLSHHTQESPGGRLHIGQSKGLAGCIIIGTAEDTSVEEVGDFIKQYEWAPRDSSDWHLPARTRRWTCASWALRVIHDLVTSQTLSTVIDVHDLNNLYYRLYRAGFRLENESLGEMRGGIRLAVAASL